MVGFALVTICKSSLKQLHFSFKVYVQAQKRILKESLKRRTGKGKSLTHHQVKALDLNRLVIQFSMMCPGIAMSTLSHGLNLHDERVKFRDVCYRRIADIVWIGEPYSDLNLIDGQIEPRSNEKTYSYERDFRPSHEMQTDRVGDNEMITTFIEKYNITDINWINYFDIWLQPTWDMDFVVVPIQALGPGSFGFLGDISYTVPHWYLNVYLWTKFPDKLNTLSMLVLN